MIVSDMTISFDPVMSGLSVLLTLIVSFHSSASGIAVLLFAGLSKSASEATLISVSI